MIFIIWLIDYFYIWSLLFQEYEIERIYTPLIHGIPSECQNSLKWYKKLYYWLSFKKKKECLNYYKLNNIPTLWKMTPVTVLNKQIELHLLTWSKFIGHAFSYIIHGFIEDSSWNLSLYFLLLVPFLFILLYILFCALCSFLFNREFSLKFWNIAVIEFSKSNNNLSKQTNNKHPLDTTVNYASNNCNENKQSPSKNYPPTIQNQSLLDENENNNLITL